MARSVTQFGRAGVVLFTDGFLQRLMEPTAKVVIGRLLGCSLLDGDRQSPAGLPNGCSSGESVAMPSPWNRPSMAARRRPPRPRAAPWHSSSMSGLIGGSPRTWQRGISTSLSAWSCLASSRRRLMLKYVALHAPVSSMNFRTLSLTDGQLGSLPKPGPARRRIVAITFVNRLPPVNARL